VDKYQEYHVRAEYSLENVPLVLSASYVRQLYEESDAADVYMAGASYHPNDKLLINATVDYRTGSAVNCGDLTSMELQPQ